MEDMKVDCFQTQAILIFFFSFSMKLLKCPFLSDILFSLQSVAEGGQW